MRHKLRNIRKKTLFIALIALGFILLSSRLVFAQKTIQGVSVTPSIAQIDLAIDSPIFYLTYKNHYDSDITLGLDVKDFTELENSYKLEFLDTTKSQSFKYSLSSWISLETKTLQLAPNEEKKIKIFIDKERISKGGHYASILAEIIKPDNKKDVAIKTVLSSLLFVRASTGKEIEEGKISSLDALRDWYNHPTDFLLRFLNSGNTYVTPYGTLMIYDPLNDLVGKGIVNEDSLISLPESIRSFNITIKSYRKTLLPGTYTAKLNLRFGKTNQTLSQDIKFFSQGSFDFIKIGSLVLIIAVLLIIVRKRISKLSNP